MFFKKKFKLGRNHVSEKRQFIVAEISGNHCGKFDLAKKLIFKSKKIGVDAVKIQAYTPEKITLDLNSKDFKVNSKNKLWRNNKKLFNLYKKAHTPIEWLPGLFDYAKKIKIDIFASVFDIDTVKILETLNCPAYKIASPEINHYPLIDFVSKKNKPIIFSTGLAYKSEIIEVIKILKKNNCRKAIILKSNTDYPANIKESHINNIVYLKKEFKILAGFSDHTKSDYSSLAASAKGSSMLEKHLKLDSTNKGIDSFFSLSPIEFKKLIISLRKVEESLGKFNYTLPINVEKNRHNMRSIYISKKVKKGDRITNENIKIVRPGYSLNPRFFYKILGKKFNKNFEKGSRLKLKDVK